MFDLPYFSEFFADFGASGTSLALHSTVPTAPVMIVEESISKMALGPTKAQMKTRMFRPFIMPFRYYVRPKSSTSALM